MQVQADLDTQLRIWYGFRWHRALEELYTARQRAQAAQTTVQARQEALQHLDEQDGTAQRHSALRNQLGDWHREAARSPPSGRRRARAGCWQRRIRQLEAPERPGPGTGAAARAAANPGRAGQQRPCHVEAGRGEMQTLAASIREAQTSLTRPKPSASATNAKSMPITASSHNCKAESAGHERRLVEQESRGHWHGRGIRAASENELRLRPSNSKAELAPQVAARQRRIAELEVAGQARRPP